MARPKRCLSVLSVAAILALPSVGLAEESGQTQCSATGAEIAELMVKTELNAVTDFAGPESEYKSDGDPDTLEIVLLPKKKGAVSHASGDGEVIFQYGNVRDKEQQQLLTLAFCLRAVARQGLATGSSGQPDQ